MLRRSVLALALALAVPAGAANVPAPSPFDSRIRTVNYNALEVYELVVPFGHETHIWFAPGELVKTFRTGDSGWDINPKKNMTNHLFLQPTEEQPETNLTVVSRAPNGAERTYEFHIRAVWPTVKDKREVLDPDVMWSVHFKYPEDEKAAKKVVQSDNQVQERLAGATSEKPRNYKYSFAGSDAYKPEEIYDDGLYTYVRFAPKTPQPSIYYVDEEGAEHIADGHIDDEWTVVHSVRKQFLFRKDNSVAGVFNDAYSASGSFNRTGTVSNSVRRVVKGGN